MKIALIGASSFLGKNIIEYVDSNFNRCRLYATYCKNKVFDQDLNIKNKNLNLIKLYINFIEKKCDLNFIKNTNLIIFVAGISKPKKILIGEYNIINIEGLKKVLRIINKKQKLIVISSTEAVGPNFNERPFDENQECKPINNYGKSKLLMEKLCLKYITQGYNINIIRPTTIFGKYDTEFLKFFKLNKLKIFPIRSKKKCIEYLHVNNLVSLIFYIYKKNITSGVYNIAPKRKVSLNYLLNIIENTTKIKWLNIYLPLKLIEILFNKNLFIRLTEFYFNSSNSKIKKIGFKFYKTTFDEYISKLYNHYKNNGQI
jgi:nucleoside-diphosphate-sugar epimerase